MENICRVTNTMQRNHPVVICILDVMSNGHQCISKHAKRRQSTDITFVLFSFEVDKYLVNILMTPRSGDSPCCSAAINHIFTLLNLMGERRKCINKFLKLKISHEPHNVCIFSFVKYEAELL